MLVRVLAARLKNFHLISVSSYLLASSHMAGYQSTRFATHNGVVVACDIGNLVVRDKLEGYKITLIGSLKPPICAAYSMITKI